MSSTTSSRAMLTSSEVRHLEGKFKSMNRLLLHPAAKNPNLCKLVKQLKGYLLDNLAFKNQKYNYSERFLIDSKLKWCALLENVLIQVVIQGKEFDEVIDVESRKPKAAFLHLCRN